MESMQTIKPSAARVLTTEQFLLFQKQELVKALIERRMAKGKAGPRNGWVMSEILADVGKRYGQEMESFAKDHITRELCGIQT
jgi:hypothetical protein